MNESPQPTPGQPPTSADHQPVPDQKTIDALLATTRAQMEQDLLRKTEQGGTAPQGFLSKLIYRLARPFDPAVLAVSPAARTRAIWLGLVYIVLFVLPFILSFVLF